MSWLSDVLFDQEQSPTDLLGGRQKKVKREVGGFLLQALMGNYKGTPYENMFAGEKGLLDRQRQAIMSNVNSSNMPEGLYQKRLSDIDSASLSAYSNLLGNMRSRAIQDAISYVGLGNPVAFKPQTQGAARIFMNSMLGNMGSQMGYGFGGGSINKMADSASSAAGSYMGGGFMGGMSGGAGGGAGSAFSGSGGIPQF